MTPFLIDMARLFESFVAEWLAEHLPAGLSVKAQESGSYDREGEIGYRIDLVLYDAAGRPLAVLDTKYKGDALPDSDDIAQVVSYATKKGCTEAVLVYPHALGEAREFMVGRVRVRAVGFALDGELDRAGERLVVSLCAGSASAPLPRS